MSRPFHWGLSLKFERLKDTLGGSIDPFVGVVVRTFSGARFGRFRAEQRAISPLLYLG
ncbi:MAG: hypothetical protein JO356_18980 [Acidobacteria bacterium]|nr:hypothetical protein [Acidobacteriota bacterium]